ncbi:MAG: nucleotidyltransferase substrate binding protein [Elusimicrobia bacterium]|nr:nucleotidyltransferase substrate binding protein [Elusimicrobiota bacterium]
MQNSYNGEKLGSFDQSLARLSEILTAPATVANRDSAIKRFELTFELSWKCLKDFLGAKGMVCRSPRDCFEQGFGLGLIGDDPLWLKMLEDRNLSVHTYNEKLAEDIYGRLKDYLRLFTELRGSLKIK